MSTPTILKSFTTGIIARTLYGITAHRIECSCGFVGEWRDISQEAATRAAQRHAEAVHGALTQ